LDVASVVGGLSFEASGLLGNFVLDGSFDARQLLLDGSSCLETFNNVVLDVHAYARGRKISKGTAFCSCALNPKADFSRISLSGLEICHGIGLIGCNNASCVFAVLEEDGLCIAAFLHHTITRGGSD